VRWGVLIFLLRWSECLPVKLMSPEVELMLCMCPPVKMLGRVGQFSFLVVCFIVTMLSNTLSANVPTLGAVGDFGKLNCQPARIYNRSTNFQ
jgi:hypothetical protein